MCLYEVSSVQVILSRMDVDMFPKPVSYPAMIRCMIGAVRLLLTRPPITLFFKPGK